MYNWKANNGFKLRDLIPAVSVTLGANAVLQQRNPTPMAMFLVTLSNPVFYGNFGLGPEKEPVVSGRATLATQSHFLKTWVFVTNFTYNRILTDFPETNYILTLTHTINPLWSVYLETQGYSSEIYADQIFRTGATYLLTDDIQLEATIGANAKEHPSLFFINGNVLTASISTNDIDPEKKAEEKQCAKKKKHEKEELKSRKSQ